MINLFGRTGFDQHELLTGFVPSMILFAIGYALLAWRLCVWLNNESARPHKLLTAAAFPSRPVSALALGTAFVVRLCCAPLIAGHPIDVNDFLAWSNHAYRSGLASFYNGDMFADYPPGYIYVLYVLGAVRNWFGVSIGSPAALVLIKLPAIMADVAAAIVVYRFALRKSGPRMASAVALLVLLNPNSFLNSTIWGQIDGIFTLLIMLMIVALTDKRLPLATVLFVIAFLVKPQSLLFAPLLPLALKDPENRRQARKAAICGVGVFAALVLPFAIKQGALWIFEHYRSMFGMYPYATFNAFNFYALIGANGTKTELSWLGVPFGAWDLLFLIAIVATVVFMTLRSRREGEGSLLYAALLLALLVFTFKTGIHERYGYAAVPLALLAWSYFRDKRLLILAVAVTVTNLGNVAYVLKLSLAKDFFVENGTPFMNVVAFANVVVALYAVWLGYALLLAKEDRSSKGKTLLPS